LVVEIKVEVSLAAAEVEVFLVDYLQVVASLAVYSVEVVALAVQVVYSEKC
jgi:hypothetical protein